MGRHVASSWLGALAVAAALGSCAGGEPAGTTAAPPASKPTTTSSTGPQVPGSPIDVRGPLGGTGAGSPATAMPAGLADRFGYVEEELVLAGTATAYDVVGELGEDGRWTVEPGRAEPYATRVLVRRPADPEDFDGTVVVEWLNVSSGQDNDVVFGHVHPELLAAGSAWVGVTAQAVGVHGGPAFEIPGVDPKPLVELDPARYGDLRHPGDAHSYDLFTQVARALRAEGSPLLGGLEPQHLLAVGESQSAARLVTYVDAVQPLEQAFDGFLLHSRSSTAASLGEGTPALPARVLIRPDLGVPVLQLITETDVLGLPFLDARQADTDRLVTWEVAGAAHLDQSLLDYRAAASGLDGPPPGETVADVCGPVNAGPQSLVARAAVAALRAWVAEGAAPQPATPIEVVDGAVVRDELGLAVGGVRTPAVDAPTVVLRGDAAPGTGYLCGLFGRTLPIDDAVLAARYPTHDAYVAEVRASAARAVALGHLLEADATELVGEAEASAIGR